jgi:hypothetical protein
MKSKTLARCFRHALLGTILVGSAWAKDQDSPLLNVWVSVFNDAQVPSEKLMEAERAASDVFARSGIVIDWLNCGHPTETAKEQAVCTEVGSPAHLEISILARSLNLKESTLGMSFQEADGAGCRADVFYAGIAHLEESGRAGSTLILGMVMAHELGHLLLGTNSHAPTGLMRAQWNDYDLIAARQGKLFFTREQSETLRTRLRAASSLSSQK